MTTTIPVPRAAAGPRVRGSERPSAARLTAVELRKMLDTRAGFWLPVGVAAISFITAAISAFAGIDDGHTLRHLFRNAMMPAALLLPVAGVLLVTGEFSQRTALSTFTLVPDRRRVLGAKIAAALVVSVFATVFCLGSAALFAAIHPGPAASHPWHFDAVVLPQGFVYLATAMLMGIGFGAAVLNSAPAIVAYLLLPTVWDALLGDIHGLAGIARWLEQGRTLDPLVTGSVSGIGWVHAGTTLAVWLVLPLAIGTRRILRRSID